ncbi:hypothetical protein C8R26_11735 [Nitrosomonas oligotropha]|uniref:Uncharacterized protein n=1 Tax=Nitrosomonas oligotropha TaxID=42354 RepID=A0A2T5HXZ1_9PROT|nr:hypothetical protein [Nitrosomonas oligotropha]PTQ76442.1 hypothetical protein C8R26_11735 [Nitrosomonas oligotropha]
MIDLLFGVGIEEIEKITGENQITIKEWKEGTKQIPEPALRLLKLFLSGDASALLGDEWNGYRFSNGLIFVPEWRNGFAPHEIRAFFWKCQQVSSLKSEIELLKTELERRNKEIDALEIKADFYKRQVVLESRFGMILERSFS